MAITCFANARHDYQPNTIVLQMQKIDHTKAGQYDRIILISR